MKPAARAGDIELLCFDETGFSCLPNVQRSWSPLGAPHTADASVGRQRANVLGALNYATRHLGFQVCEHSVRREHVIAFLERVAVASDRAKFTFIVMDNASIHLHIEPTVLERWMIKYRFVPLYLPPYSPELNMIEILWKQAKYHCRAFTSWTRETLAREVTELIRAFGEKYHIGYT